MKYIDKFLNSITMYKLVLYGLLSLAVYAVFFNGPHILLSLIVLFIVCFIANYLLSKLFRAPINAESASISALILFFIISPEAPLPTLVLVGCIAMLSKYVLVIRKKHIFNPVAVGAVVLTLLGNGNVSWWAGSSYMLPVVAIVGLLIVHKIRRFYLFISFAIAAGIVLLLMKIPPMMMLSSWPLLFFGTIMLTEPLSTPPTRRLQVAYGVITGILFGYTAPEIALVIGNIFSYIVSPKQLLVLQLKEKKEIAASVWEFVFSTPKKLAFTAGQYAEWTLPHEKIDSRGNRRYFTMASSPTETDIRLGIRLNEPSSSFKKALKEMPIGGVVTVSQVSGDFILPKDTTKKLAFIAGGIGVTPFRSIIKYIEDTHEKRDVVLFYLAMNPLAFAYKDVFAQTKTIYTDKLTPEQLAEYKDRTFYISGPNMMVDVYKKMLKEMGVKEIITDYFPGY